MKENPAMKNARGTLGWTLPTALILQFIGGALAAPLHDAVKEGDIEKVRKLVAGGANVNEKNPNTPVEYAAAVGNKEMVQYLLDNTAEPTAVSLRVAAGRGHVGVVEALLASGLSPDLGAEDGTTALHAAVGKARKDIVSLLLARGAKVNVRNKQGETPLVTAVREGDANLVELLAEKGADLKWRNDYGSSLLHIVAYRGHKEVVELLIKRGTVLDAVNRMGDNALDTALQFGHPAVADVLGRHGLERRKTGSPSPAKLPATLESDSWVFVISGVEARGRSVEYYDLSGYSGEVEEIMEIPPGPVIPNISMAQAEGKRGTAWVYRHGDLVEGMRSVAMIVSVRNKTKGRLPLLPNGMRLQNEYGVVRLAIALKFMKSQKSPVYKTLDDGETPLGFPSEEDVPMEVLFSLPQEVRTVDVILPTVEGLRIGVPD